MTNKLIRLSLISISSLFIFSCSNSKFKGFEEVEGGNYFKEYVNGSDTSKPRVGDVIFMKILLSTESDSVLYDSKKSQQQQPDAIRCGEPFYAGDFYQMLMKCNVGDSIGLKIRANDYYKAQKMALPPYLDSLSFLQFEIKIDSIMRQAELEKKQNEKKEAYQKKMEEMKVQEPAMIEKYLADNAIKTPPRASGLYFIEKKKGSGAKVAAGDSVEVNYVGKFVDGTVFDSSEGHPEPFRFRVGLGAVIPAWEEAIMAMSEGSKVLLISPSAIAYGPMGSGPIPPYTPLVFEVEVKKILDIAKK